MGAPLEDAARLQDWSNWIQRQFGMSVRRGAPADRAGGRRSSTRTRASCSTRRRDDPGDDLISTLIAAEQRGRRGSPTSSCVNLVLNVLVGGVDTTQSQLAHALRLFAEHPEQWALLAERPGARAARGRGGRCASSRSRRSPRGSRWRTSTTATSTFPEGTVVLVCAFTGNRDPAPTRARRASTSPPSAARPSR